MESAVKMKQPESTAEQRRGGEREGTIDEDLQDGYFKFRNSEKV